MSPKNPGKALKSIRARIACPASNALTTAAVCVSVRENAVADSSLCQLRIGTLAVVKSFDFGLIKL